MSAAKGVPPPPPCIDDFDVGQELGKGGFAVVYRARVRSSGLEVALKVVDKQRACEHLAACNPGDSGGRSGAELACERVANEVRLHWGLKHPTVVELLDFFEDERFVYMVLELCGRGDMYRWLRRRGALGEDEARGYMGQLLAGLAYLHERGVMHRDLKLSNLLLSEDGRRLRIGDFGLAVKLEDEDHERHTICGTPNYMAPEVQGSGYGLSADLWSAGCLFYTMVTGAAPFQGQRVGDTLANACAGVYVEPDGLSDAAVDFLACMLNLNPSRRIRVDQAAAHPFLRLDDQRPKGATTDQHGALSPKRTTSVKRGGAKKGSGRVSSDVKSRNDSKRDGVCRGDRSAQSSPDGGSRSGGGAGNGGGGHSTLTASTAVIGTDRCSLNSSLMEDGASFSTLRAEAVPTPAIIGEGAAAAAARVRHAAARASFRVSAEASTRCGRVKVNVADGVHAGAEKLRAGEDCGRQMEGTGDGVVLRLDKVTKKGHVDEARARASQSKAAAAAVVGGKSGKSVGLRVSAGGTLVAADERRRSVEREGDGGAANKPSRSVGRDVAGWHDTFEGCVDDRKAKDCLHRTAGSPDETHHQRQQQQLLQRRRRRARRPHDASSHNPQHDQRVTSIPVERRHHGEQTVANPSYTSNDSLSPIAAPHPRATRRRPRPTGGRDGDTATTPPPPPRPSLSPPPPPLPGDDALSKLRELRAAAMAQRCLREPWCERSSTTISTGAKRDQVLARLCTARVNPVSHHSGGRAAIEVLPDGRASITVGKRWLMTSRNGDRVWAGVGTGRGCSEVIRESSVSVRGGEQAELATGSGYSFQSLPEALHPLYKSLAGIVNALRSKTPKVVLRRGERGVGEPGGGGGGGGGVSVGEAAAPAELVLCALMDNLPDPDFTAAFDDGTSLSLWTRKNELRVELPCGRVRSWTVGGRSAEWWPVDVALGGVSRRSQEASSYLRLGLEGYCRCLREEAAAYERGAAKFPVEIVVAGHLVVASTGRTSWRDDSLGEAKRWQQQQQQQQQQPVAAAYCTAKAVSAATRGESRTRNGRSEVVGWGGERSVVKDERSQPRQREELGCWWRGGDADTSSESSLENRIRYASGISASSSHRDRSPRNRSSSRSRSSAKAMGDVDLAGLHLDRTGDTAECDRQQQQRRCREPQHRADALPPPLRRSPSMPSRLEPDGHDLAVGDGGVRPLAAVPGTPTRGVSLPLFPVHEAPEYGHGRRGVFEQSDRGKPSKRDRNTAADTASLTCSPVSEVSAIVRRQAADGGGGGGGGDGDGGDGGARAGKGRELVGRGRADGVAVIPGLGEAFRDCRGDLEVRFSDGVVVVVDARARWMRVQQPSVPRPATTCEREREQRAVTYDLGKDATRRSGVGNGSGAGERMPRDVKERMKALPRFISILKRGSGGLVAAAAAPAVAAGARGEMHEESKKFGDGGGGAGC